VPSSAAVRGVQARSFAINKREPDTTMYYDAPERLQPTNKLWCIPVYAHKLREHLELDELAINGTPARRGL
jgi:hypothetical protein